MASCSVIVLPCSACSLHRLGHRHPSRPRHRDGKRGTSGKERGRPSSRNCHPGTCDVPAPSSSWRIGLADSSSRSGSLSRSASRDVPSGLEQAWDEVSVLSQLCGLVKHHPSPDVMLSRVSETNKMPRQFFPQPGFLSRTPCYRGASAAPGGALAGRGLSCWWRSRWGRRRQWGRCRAA